MPDPYDMPPLPPRADPEAEIADLVRKQTREVVARIAAMAARDDVPIERTLNLLSSYADHSRAVLQELSVPHSMGSGAMAPMGGMFAQMADVFRGPMQATRIQALSAAYRSAVDTGDTALAERLRRELNNEIGPEEGNVIGDIVPMAAPRTMPLVPRAPDVVD